ncbi:DUF2141 domain-containing protein [Pelagerythrobacter sp.]|uniref:DUF2141 domain-containing protein n=1 Tax=Pelagerythrobacter sp. TaxID=2800702 RepID=UPI0035B11DF5
MRHRPRPERRLFALTLAAAAPLALGAGAPQAAPEGAEVTVEISGLRSDEGVVRACMTTDADRFPRCRGVAGAHSATVTAREDGPLRLTFHGVAPGRYAIALLHDENANGKADRALGMMPKEGFGFSRDAKVRLGPPRFDDAAFEVGGRATTQTIHMRYML